MGVATVGTLGKDILIIVDCEEGSFGTAMYSDGGDKIYSFQPSREMSFRFYDSWQEMPDDRKWGRAIISLDGTKFTVSYVYPDEIDPDELPWEIRDQIVMAKYGDKPLDQTHWRKDSPGFFND